MNSIAKHSVFGEYD